MRKEAVNKDFLEEDHYGLAIDNDDFTNRLDDKFQKFIKTKF